MLRNWLQAILQLSDFFGVSLRDLLAILTRIVSIGLPPAISDAVAIRRWIGLIGDVAADIADLTETTADDQLAEFCRSVIHSDDTWSVVYSLLQLIATQDDDAPRPDEVILERVAFAMPEGSGLSPSVILTIVTLIWKIIDALRED